ncbi:ATP-binding protein [Actinomadura hibisca]|uniref:ATP-binding protein n=1 Tax=Actinomadura hibisca TaxID=68565 RepID=UPI001FDFC962|nr:LuxR C-terminal-related transcriptional regulator [Actinomadura hibisca]
MNTERVERLVTVLAAEGRAGNLPAEVTRFVGRAQELAEVADLVERERLVTLCGPGGVGKTRLALRLAADLRPSFADGAWLVELSALREPQLLPRLVAEALGLCDQTARDAVQSLEDYLSDRHLLLVLDTCEHMVDACAMLAELLLRAAPRLHVLVTGRQPLDLLGEHTYALPPLAVADAGSGPDPDSDSGGDSVALFADRAAASAPGFEITPDNRAQVARLCRRLEGIPLAIELAAVRLRTMSLDQIAARLDDRFRVLGTARTRHARHQTLHAAVSWSHELCTPEEQALWGRLSVFPGDFDDRAAEAVCTGGPACGDVLDLLGALVDKSVLLRDRDTGRYRMLDTLREFGAGLLDAPAAAELRDRHLRHYLALAEHAERGISGPDQTALITGLGAERHNLRVALDHAFSAPGAEPAALRLTRLLYMPWVILGLFGEARGWAQRALTLRTAEDPAGNPADGSERCWALYSAVVLAALQGDGDAARPLLDELVRVAPACADAELSAHVPQARGLVSFFTGDTRTAAEHLEEALTARRALGCDHPRSLVSYPLLAGSYGLLGRAERAMAVADEGLRETGRVGDAWNGSALMYSRGLVRWTAGDAAGAMPDVLASLRLKDGSSDALGHAITLDLAAVCAADLDAPDRAATLLGFTALLWERLRVPMLGPAYAALRQSCLESLRERLGEERLADGMRHGASHTLAEATALALGEADSGGPGPAAGRRRARSLTPREREIAGLVAEGLSNRRIAERLVIAKRTVDSHVEHILAKLEVASRAQVAVWVERHGHASGDDPGHADDPDDTSGPAPP